MIHYCVANMPGAVPNTATLALSQATMPFILQVANFGWKNACFENPHLLNGLNVHNGHITNKAVAIAQNLHFVEPDTFLNS